MSPVRRPFRFGVVNETVLPREEWIAHVRGIEEIGYASFLIRDHLAPDFYGPQFGPLVALATAAAVTTTLRVGMLVIDNDFRHPAILAKEAATLDFLSGGRLELGIGAGWLRNEYDQAGLDFDPAGVRIGRLAESLRVLKGLFGGGPFTFKGEHYRLTEIESFPTPEQRPRPPILIGAGKRRMLRLAGREADIISLLTVSVGGGAPEDDPRERLAASVAEKIEWIRQGAGERFGEIELALTPSTYLSDDREGRAAQLIAERGWQGVTIEDVLGMPSVFIGTLDQICTQMKQRRDEYGFSYFTVSDKQVESFAPIVAQLAGT